MQRWLTALTALAVWAAPDQVVAASITWGPATTISGDADVSTVGALFGAHNVQGPTVVINGVTFASLAVSTANFAFTSAGTLVGVDGPFGSAQAPFASLSADYKGLLDSGIFTHTPPNQPPSITLTISGLSIGQPYEFQWWVNDSRDTGDFDRTTTATAGDSVSLEHNFANLEGGVGQFALGSFLADATTQAIVFQGFGMGANVGSTQVNGFQLRAIPEPSSVGMVALGIAFLALAARFHQPNQGETA